MSEPAQTSLFFALADEPWCAVLSGVEPEGGRPLNVRGEGFSLLEEQAGFYDFLRNNAGMVIGLRFSTFSNKEILLDAVERTNTTVDVERQFLEVRLCDEQVVPSPAEQGFGDDSIWRSATGTYAILVGTWDLTDTDISHLRDLSGLAE